MPPQAVPRDGPVPGVWWVFLSDRGPGLEARLEQRYSELASTGAIERRTLRGSVVLGPGDLAPFHEYVEAVESLAGPVRVGSRFLNAVSVTVDDRAALQALLDLPFVASARPVAASSYRDPVPLTAESWPEPGVMSEGQLSQVGLSALHQRGWAGSGVLIGVLDSGFDLDHVCFADIVIVDEYDFVGDDSVTCYQEGDPASTGNHGAAVLSILGGYEEGIYSGGAPAAGFLLMRTEDTGDEYQQEEDFWVEGLEWAEERGADVISSSLGYIDWYGYEDMDGNTAVTTIAADSAAARGLLVVNAIGNNGPSPGTLIAPADGDLVLSVGGVTSLDEVVEFSSRGPTYDGRTKPDAMARAYYTSIANYSTGSGYIGGNGTSFSTPLLTSVVSIMLEHHPEWGPEKVLEIIRATASRSGSPDNDYGWGIARGVEAVVYSSIAGQVRRSDDGSPLAAYPLEIDCAGSSYQVSTNGQGWFLLEPESLGPFHVSGAGGPGEVLGVWGSVGEEGVELTVFVDMYDPSGPVGEPSVYPDPCVPGAGCSHVYVGFDLEAPGDVSLTVFTLDGRAVYSEVRTGLQQGAYRAPLPGEAFSWDWTGESGDMVSSGIYLFCLRTDRGVTVIKAALAR
ncbi:S8 family serine peptidase [Candidatus Fermentibacterales bacterium]|nr:S8 family serine peptidase [Candidatus Fermentibacterales bacterium]